MRVSSFLSLQNRLTLPGQWDRRWFDLSRQQMILYKDCTFFLWACCRDTKPVKLLSDSSFPKEILFAKVSIDTQLLAVMPDRKSVVVYDLRVEKHWKVKIKNIAGNNILPDGILWSDHGGNSQDLVIVTSKGIELYKISSARGQCKLSRSVMQSTHFFCYEPNFRALLLGLSLKDGTIEMAGFYLRYDLSDIPRLELPPPEKMPVFRLDQGSSSKGIETIVLYGNLFLAVHYTGPITDSIALYDLSRGQSQISMALSYPLNLNSDVIISVADNLLCCHCMQHQLTFVLDIHILGKTKLKKHERQVSFGNGNMSFGACTLMVDDASSNKPLEKLGGLGGLGDLDGFGGSNGFSSPVKNLLRGFDEKINLESQLANEKESECTKKIQESVDGKSPPHGNVPSARHIAEPYEGIWRFIAPNWVWDPHVNQLYQIKCNYEAVVSTVQSAEIIVRFLSVRGLPMDAPRPIYHNDVEVGSSAKALLFLKLFHGILEKTPENWFYYFFCEVARCYAIEYHKNQNDLLQPKSNIRDINGKASASSPVEKMRSSSSAQPSSTTRKNVLERGSHHSMPARRLINLARQAKRTSTTNAAPRQERDEAGADLWADDLLLDCSRESFLPDVSDQPLELSGLESNLPDITAIGQSSFLDKKLSVKRRPSLKVLAQTSANETCRMKSIEDAIRSSFSIRRNSEGSLILTQSELLNYIFLPMAVEYSSCSQHGVDCLDFLVSTLKCYLAALKSSAVRVDSSLTMLLLNLLLCRRKYIELANMVQFQFFSDSSVLAAAMLALSDMMSDICCCNEGSKDASVVGNAKELDFAIKMLQQSGLDMLWRGKEYGTAIRWMLEHDRIDEAIHHCVSLTSSMKNTLISVPGIDFYNAVLRKISSFSNEKIIRGTKNTVFSQEDKVSLMCSIHAFLTKWEPSLFSYQQKTGKSRLASASAFPENEFTEDNEVMLKCKFGYISEV